MDPRHVHNGWQHGFPIASARGVLAIRLYRQFVKTNREEKKRERKLAKIARKRPGGRPLHRRRRKGWK